MTRVLHAPLNIGGHVNDLFLAEKRRGLDSHLLLARPDDRLPEIAGTLSTDAFGRGFVPTPGVFRRRRRFLQWALENIDVFHFNFGRSLLDFPYIPFFQLRDLERLRASGKRILFTFQGCDARDKWDHLGQTVPSACPSCRVPWCGLKSLVRRNRLQRVREYADRVFVLNPDLVYRLPDAEFLPYAIADPVAGRDSDPPKAGEGVVTVVHAPTDRAIKGSELLIDAVDRLARRGVRIRLDLVEGVTRAEVLRRIAGADIVVDQLRIGWYGGLAVEAMWLGKPTICYINEGDARGVVPAGLLSDLPISRAGRGDLPDLLAGLAADADLRHSLGLRGRSFAERWHSPDRVVERVIRHYEG